MKKINGHNLKRGLIPCPFCGGKWKVERNINLYGRCRATCKGCGKEVEGSDYSVLKENVNMRKNIENNMENDKMNVTITLPIVLKIKDYDRANIYRDVLEAFINKKVSYVEMLKVSSPATILKDLNGYYYFLFWQGKLSDIPDIKTRKILLEKAGFTGNEVL